MSHMSNCTDKDCIGCDMLNNENAALAREVASLKTSLLSAEARGYQRAIDVLKGQLMDEHESGFDVKELQWTIEFLEDRARRAQSG